MPTIRDVAELAGVAPITVSRVINNSGYVSQETRARVNAAVAELNYVPNTLARSLRFKETGLLALVVTDITNPYWTTIARGVEDAANENGLNVILCNTDENEDKQIEYLRVLLQKQVDGFLLAPARSTPQPVDLIQKQGVPVVVLDRQIPGAQVDVVRSDSFDGAREIVHYLISLGHRRIAMLSGPQRISTAEQRVAGYCAALQEAGLEVRREYIHYGEYNQRGGYRMALQALEVNDRPTAIFAANNFIAVGALRALREANLHVPSDMSIVCFDDIPSWQTVDPFLTVVAQPAYAMGEHATRLLIERLSGVAPEGQQEIVLPTEIILRTSCAPIDSDT